MNNILTIRDALALKRLVLANKFKSVREELSGNGQEVTINFAGTLGALVRELKPYIDKENKRVGISLVKGIS